jgi:hypothetical protein
MQHHERVASAFVEIMIAQAAEVEGITGERIQR